jgi:phosphohistidine phosphatase SixA
VTPRRPSRLGIVSYSAKVLDQKTTLPQRKHALEKAARDVMIVGHLPFLGKLAALFITGSEANEIVEFYGSIVCIERRDEGKLKIAWMITPALLHG